MSTFVPQQVTRTYVQTLAGPPDRILPLLTPEGERHWAEGWDPTVLHDAPGRDGTVFVTRAHGHADTLWLLVRYDEVRGYVRYYRITPDSNVTELDVALRAVSPGVTQATVRYTYTGLSDEGNRLVASRTEEYYREFMMGWETALNRYLNATA